VGMLRELVSAVPNEPTSLKTMIAYQIENLGYIDVVDKKYAGFCVVTDLNIDFSPKLKLYALANGNTIPVKIDKKTFKANQVRRGDIIKVTSQYRKNKLKKVDGQWVQSDEKEWWLAEYKIC
jgi:DNA polymerase-3 subunit alpha